MMDIDGRWRVSMHDAGGMCLRERTGYGDDHGGSAAVVAEYMTMRQEGETVMLARSVSNWVEVARYPMCDLWVVVDGPDIVGWHEQEGWAQAAARSRNDKKHPSPRTAKAVHVRHLVEGAWRE